MTHPLYFQRRLSRLAPGEMELGMGIHGEPGAWRGPAQPIDAIVAQVRRGALLTCCVSDKRSVSISCPSSAQLALENFVTGEQYAACAAVRDACWLPASQPFGMQVQEHIGAMPHAPRGIRKLGA